VYSSQAIVTKNRVYLLGCSNDSAALSTVYTAPINADGTLGTWTTGTSLPEPLAYSQAIVTKNRVYLLGGWKGSPQSIVYTAPINADGTLGTWTTGTSLPASFGYSQAIVTKNRVYLLGAGSSSTVYTAPINADGTLGTWTTGTPLPDGLCYSQAVVTKNRVYLLGGRNGIGAAISTVYTAPINADGTLGTWTAGTSLPDGLCYSQAIVTKNRVYLIAGYINGSISNKVYTAPIDSTGNIGTWTESLALPIYIYAHSVTIIKNKLYVIGGVCDGTGIPLVYIAHIESDGTISSWSKGTSLPASIYYTSLACTRNRVYLIGGIVNGSASSAIYGADINTDGSLDTWQLVDNLPDTMNGSTCLLTSGGLYVIGGYVNGGISTRVNMVYASGGLNDYSYYYSAAVTPVMGNTFSLPDYTTFEASSLYAYIKY
jgi:N-acetylneuraminic acid mutarotase